LKTLLDKQTKLEKCGESWELSAVQGDISKVSNGFLKGNSLEEIIEIYMGDLVGDKIYEQYGIEFPLLIKFIDASDDLSIQVHPNDDLALERHNSYGKTEMWYIMDVVRDAKLISGFNKPVTKEEYLQHVTNNSLEKIMNTVTVSPGDAFFIPSGRVHAIGAGILLAEIQQTSDVTYRIFDYNRKDANGKQRDLHTDLAIDAIDYAYVENVKTEYENKSGQPVRIAACPYFTTNRLNFSTTTLCNYAQLDSFVIFICCKGNFEILYNGTEKITVQKGETVLLPALLDEVILQPLEYTELLEVYIE
jgi:mannose-6-phosphate isomerase